MLAKSLGWGHVTPLLSLGLRPRDLRLRGDALRLACHRAVEDGVRKAVPVAGELARAAARRREVVPKLRAKAAGRAAWRLCDRLVALGALRELSGRDTFRLYGV